MTPLEVAMFLTGTVVPRLKMHANKHANEARLKFFAWQLSPCISPTRRALHDCIRVERPSELNGVGGERSGERSSASATLP